MHFSQAVLNKLVPPVKLDLTPFDWTLKPSDALMALHMIFPVAIGNHLIRAMRALERLHSCVYPRVVEEVGLVNSGVPTDDPTLRKLVAEVWSFMFGSHYFFHIFVSILVNSLIIFQYG
jgi:hypothetical protein